ncbi:DUF4928 family protein [Natronoglycomyces albus]|uniref:DUF4928 family protein n=1 Tax=Natronoglycomyces albus TaxID=2811108 RepID=A0A895XKL8_9ACTN|nr:DUF4928 family protein [Natronoglycomyces albus]QSB03969.1 DUF4928 family protein [Natronoglycomyces albus]
MTSPAPSGPNDVEVFRQLVTEIEGWYEDQRKSDGRVDPNVMCAGVYAADHLSRAFPLTENDYRTKSQVKGASGSRIKKLLAAHGEERVFLREGGRTSRGTVTLVASLANLINDCLSKHYSTDPNDQARAYIAWSLQEWFVNKIQVDFFDKERLQVEIDPQLPVAAAVAAMIEAGRVRGGNAAGAVAQHLVGAKLELRFPDITINNESYTTADQQTNRAGDFQVGDTGIHVTTSPSQALFTTRCAKNLTDGYRPRVLVPDDKVAAAEQLRELAGLGRQVAVQAIEDFVGTNIEEIAQFTSAGVKSGLRQLLETYNTRVNKVEVDKSLMIEAPQNL